MNDGAPAPTPRSRHAVVRDAGPRATPVVDSRDPAAVDAALLRWATALTKDPTEAQALIAQARGAGDPAEDKGPAHPDSLPAAAVAPLSETQIFRLLRQSYHSVERTRRRRPMRDAVVTSLAEAAEQRG